MSSKSESTIMIAKKLAIHNRNVQILQNQFDLRYVILFSSPAAPHGFDWINQMPPKNCVALIP